MLEFIADLPNPIAKKFVARAVLGSINMSLTGTLGRILRTSLPEEGSGIDGYNEAILDAENPTAPVGLEPNADPKQVASALIGCRARILDLCSDLPDTDLPTDLGSTIQYMIDRDPPQGGAAVEALSKALDLSVEELEAARKAMFTRDREFLIENKEELVELQTSIEYTEPETAFDQLPARTQVRLAEKARAAIQRQTGFAIEAVLKGRLDAASDITLNKAVIKSIDDWLHTASERDPAIKEAMEQAA